MASVISIDCELFVVEKNVKKELIVFAFSEILVNNIIQ